MERPESGYPPYNIEKTGEDQYRIVLAVAGFTKSDIEVVQEQNRLSVHPRR
jgi:molecular chaperone IbpA